jgi:hypothetical protein
VTAPALPRQGSPSHRYTALVTFAAGLSPSLREEVVDTLAWSAHPDEVREELLQPSLPGAVRGGDLIWRLAFDDDAAACRWTSSPAGRATRRVLSDPSLVASTEEVTYAAGRTFARDVAAGRLGDTAVHRTLLLRAEADEATLERFALDLVTMGEQIPVMREWRLSRVESSSGSTAWTHVWEQVFPSLDELLGSYMAHPYHWAHVDRWFDRESTARIVEPTYCHTFCLVP